MNHILIWTPTAIDCLNLHCECKKCLLYYLYFRYSPTPCKMKYTIKELVEKVGLPKNNEKKN